MPAEAAELEAETDVGEQTSAASSRSKRVVTLGWLGRLLGRGCLRLLGAGSIAVFLLLAVGPHVFDYRTVTMRSGSMRPFAGPGDILVVRPERFSAIRPGQVLTFVAPLPGRPVLSHRVVAVVTGPGGTVSIRTKGDSNAAVDSWLARLDDSTAWHTVTVVPALGKLLALLHSGPVRAVTVWLLPVWLAFEVLRRLWRPTPVPLTTEPVAQS